MSNVREMYIADANPLFDRDDLEYRLYLQDHKKAILDSCAKITMDPNQQAKYKYRMRKYLYDHQHEPSADWLVLWLNDMTGPIEFKNKKELLIPDWGVIETLYSQHRTLRTRLKSARAQLAVKI